jgi:hypothetical protein
LAVLGFSFDIVQRVYHVEPSGKELYAHATTEIQMSESAKKTAENASTIFGQIRESFEVGRHLLRLDLRHIDPTGIGSEKIP